MTRDIRYQGVVLRDSHLLLVKHREHDSGHAYWIMPGGGRDPGETEEASRQYAISEVGWFDLRHPHGWDPLVKTDPFTYPLLLRLQALLGYTPVQAE